jgi:2-oxoglutarate dehydrogenase E1 component
MSKVSFQELQQSSALSGANASYIEDLYDQYLANPQSVALEWQHYFATLADKNDVAITPIKQQFIELGRQSARYVSAGNSQGGVDTQQAAVTNLINAYRLLGHLQAKIDPLGLMEIPKVPELTLAYHNLKQSDLETEFDAGGACNMFKAPLKEIINTLEKTYNGTIGAEIMHIPDTQRRHWLLKRFEEIKGQPRFSKEEKLRILEKQIAAHGLEKYLGTKYVGQKRFSIEGADTVISMMDALTYHGAKNGVKELVVGMAHRGRLNMLVNFLGKAPATLFDEFEGKVIDEFSGDVKYHKGFSSNVLTPNGVVHLAMAYNPSHLETVDPVVEGSVHAKQWRRNDEARQQVLPVLLHGDASFAGQGVVQETFNFSQVAGFTTGGTIHIVVNNQIGFTTTPKDGRSTRYCTDIAKMVDAPIFHVNADDPEACVFVLQLLYDYRKAFNQDVVVDLVCYRRHGHNEADEPSMTQPLMYQVIKKHPTPYEVYAERLLKEGVITEENIDEMTRQYRQALDSGQPVVEIQSMDKRGAKNQYAAHWDLYKENDWRAPYETTLTKKSLLQIANKIIELTDRFTPQPQVGKMLAGRVKMAAGEQSIDWGFAETLAYGTLLVENCPVRISGEDAQRGTFGHRHAMLHHYDTGECYMPLNHLSDKQAPIWIYNTVLSEYAVMGFEVGYASAAPETLVIWEAQFGDFANGAQIIIDQFLSSGEQKWKQKSGLVLLLPHGYEGQGPEHSSARLERYLQLCAQHNMQVCVPTTPAQVFHMLRRQALRKLRKPLIVMTPKSMLRAPLAVSTLDELANGKFEVVIGEVDENIKPKKVTRVILCSGKIYYDLLTKRREENITAIAIIRIEQLYPFPDDELKAELAKYSAAKQVVWTQEEPLNQGAWYPMQHKMVEALQPGQVLDCVTRPASAAPAGGYMASHILRQQKVVNDALQLGEK